MTLCTAWIRQVNDSKELIFATDTCLSMGERWDYGIKLFELPGNNGLICFAGDTYRTYPLILNFVSAIQSDPQLKSMRTDFNEVVKHLAALFSQIIEDIREYGTTQWKEVVGDFSFLIGGWSYQSSDFVFGKLEYDFNLNRFDFTEKTNGPFYFFIGDELNDAEAFLAKKAATEGLLPDYFDMEPLQVLLQMIREPKYDSIDGRINLAKIHLPGETEFLGVMWPNENGKRTFQGREVEHEINGNIRYIDPETGIMMDQVVPEMIEDFEHYELGEHFKFVTNCYESGKLKKGLKDQELRMLHTIFTKVAYHEFLDRNSEITEEEQ